jgi:DNA (cytosine-5)-methyltransferase 1
MLRMLDLFAGIGGFSYAGEKLVGGYETVAFCEYDEHAQKVLRKHWPDTEIIGDIRELANDADRFRGMVDIITGGYPCQPFSTAGQRRGDQDDRHLWPEMLRVIKAVRPRWVIGENVAGHISMGLDTVLSDLEAAGYASRCYVIPAVAADAPHRRDRCWIVAHSDDAGQPADRRSGQGKGDKARHNARRCGQALADAGCQRSGAEISRSGGQSIDGAAQGQRTEARNRFADCSETVAHADCVGGEDKHGHQTDRQEQQFNGAYWWKPEPELGRVANGIPGRVHRLKQLGNSIVPQVAARILHAIKEADDAP